MGFAFCLNAQAVQLEADVKYPVPMGQMAQGYNSNPGFAALIYMPPLLNPSINNYLSVGYMSLGIKADGASGLRFIPILAGIELPGKFSENFYSTLGLASGVGIVYVNVPGILTYNMNAYFVVQLKPGFEYSLSESLSLVGH